MSGRLPPTDGYDLSAHGAMLRDERRVDAYLRALRRVVTPQSVVLDIGTGVGFFAIAAAQMGARRVLAIERDDVAYVARSVAEANGVAGRVTTYQGSSTDLVLDEMVDVVVSDLHGVLPWFGSHLSAIIDARSRLLRPGGILIPQSDEVWACLVGDAELYHRWAAPWSEPYRGVDLSAVRPFAVNGWGIVRLTESQMASLPAPLARLDYAEIREPDMHASVQLRPAVRTIHGVALWFDSNLGAETRLSNAPTSEPLVYGQAFFPFEEPIVVTPGVMLDIQVKVTSREAQHWWAWSTTLIAPDGESTLVFQQSTIKGLVLPPENIRPNCGSGSTDVEDQGPS